MAVRSGAGTGVIVSLVVFILTTVFLLILSIVFYAGKTKALESEANAQSSLATYVKPQERNRDVFKSLEGDAKANGQSVAQFMSSRHENLMLFLNGDASASMEQVKADMSRLGVGEDDVVRTTLENAQRSLRAQETEITGLKGRLEDRERELQEKDEELSRARDAHRRELEIVSQEINKYGEASREQRDRVNETIQDMRGAVDRLEAEYEDRIDELESDLDASNQDLVLLRARLDEYEAILEKIKTRATSPDLLVDAEVIDVEAANDLVFINRGRKDRIVRGMTFEIYDDAASINVNQRTGAVARGKASVQVTKVGEATSTCKVTRSVAGRPVVRGNILANAIYDPTYRFKFLVHGKFDVDNDGNPTEQEAEFLRGLVLDWGGEVIYGEEVPGDLDFLVLGEEPDRPTSPPAGASEAQVRIYLAKRQALKRYEDLKKSASEAQIPVLNANRFFILTGRAR